MTFATAGNLECESHTRLWYRISNPEKFIAMGEEVTFKRGAIVQGAGQRIECCWYVLSGKVMAVEYTAATGERCYYFNEEDSLIMEAGALIGRPSPVNFVAVSETRLVRIPTEKLLEAIEQDNEICQELLMSLSYKFLSAMDQVREGTQCSVSWKVCNLLLTFADRYGVPYDGKVLIKEKISQQMMANLLGVNRITMVRTVKELREMGFIEQINGFYCIRDREKMKEYMRNTAEQNIG